MRNLAMGYWSRTLVRATLDYDAEATGSVKSVASDRSHTVHQLNVKTLALACRAI